jgi:MurNAc alpha-1-phosphate uridylyltransferase
MTAIPKSAMILSAGLGLRMRPLTDTRPKPLIEVAGKALLAYNLECLTRAGIDQIVVNIHHLGGQIRDYLHTKNYQQVKISDETERLLDSGGGVKKALPLLGSDPFFIINADSFFIDGPQKNLQRLAEAFDPEKMDALLLLAGGLQMTGYEGLGDFFMDAEGRLTRRVERVVAPFVYTGVALITPSLFTDTPDGPFSLNLLFNRAIEKTRLFGLRLDGEWLHVGTPEAIAEAETQLAYGVTTKGL